MSQRIIHVISSLAAGGAELSLLALVTRLRELGFDNRIVVLGSDAPLKQRFLDLGVPVHVVGMSRGSFPGAREVVRLLRLGRALQPDLIHGWMAHGNLAAVLMRFARLKAIPVIWSVHQTLGRFDALAKTTRFSIRALARLSWMPRRIIYVSKAGREEHRLMGFRDSRAVHIPNGVDESAFRGGTDRRAQARSVLGLAATERVVGHVGRYHPAKDYRTLAAALEMLLHQDRDAFAVLIGSGLTDVNPEFAPLLSDARLSRRFRLLGFRDDIAELLPAFDVFCLSSVSEACPVALLEAMSSELRSVVTDAGDAAWMQGGSGEVVTAGDSPALAAALARMLRLPLEDAESHARRARERVLEHFSLDRMAERYRVIYQAAIEGRAIPDSAAIPR